MKYATGFKFILVDVGPMLARFWSTQPDSGIWLGQHHPVVVCYIAIGYHKITPTDKLVFCLLIMSEWDDYWKFTSGSTNGVRLGFKRKRPIGTQSIKETSRSPRSIRIFNSLCPPKSHGISADFFLSLIWCTCSAVCKTFGAWTLLKYLKKT